MTPGVWIVPIALLGVVVLLWGSAWFEGRVAPLGNDPELRTLAAVDPVSADSGADRRSLGAEDQHAIEVDRPAA